VNTPEGADKTLVTASLVTKEIGSVRNFPSAAVSGGDFWRAAKTGGRRTPGRQPTQVFIRPCRRAQSVLAEIFDF